MTVDLTESEKQTISAALARSYLAVKKSKRGRDSERAMECADIILVARKLGCKWAEKDVP